MEPHAFDIETAGQELFDYAIDREDVKWLLANLPEAADISRATVEYELQILKIISVGWSITYYLEDYPEKDPLQEWFWKAIFEFARGLTQTTELMIGQDIDYFQTLRDRLDMYVDTLSKNPDTEEPAGVVGPAFAYTCGNAEDIFTTMTGAKMFVTTITRVRAYLDAISRGSEDGT